MPRSVQVRVGGRVEEPGTGPRPFSQEWMRLPEDQRTPPPRQAKALPGWLPSDRILAAILVMLLVFVTVVVSGGPALTSPNSLPAAQNSSGDGSSASVIIQPPSATATSAPSAPTPTVQGIVLDSTQAAGGEVGSTPEATKEPVAVDPRAILPKYRILAYYGHPASDQMGILGEYDKDQLLEQLLDEAKVYEEADPSRPIMPAFELIASVAQDWPADDNTYLLHTDRSVIQEYVDYTKEKGILLILDLQIGHSTVPAEIDKVRQFLDEPHVHLAIDPEFSMPEGVVPGSQIGGVDASEVAYAQEELAKIVAENDLPPKVLIVHRFTENMIRNDDQLRPVEGVQVVIDFDGFGDPATKSELYRLFLQRPTVEFAGIKLFYRNPKETPLMQPREVVALEPSPDYVMYQ